ncbi:MAG: YegS/Rv2252/BmrU family lipid kinase [Bacteroidetes bacterium]|nr:YegS/Rv2252/BmrU family lipid kinase [Bacteroidota bacterium]
MGNKKKILFIINPVSGTGRQKGFEKVVERRLDRQQYEYSFAYTRAIGHGTELASNALAEGVEVVVAVGGDGSVNQIAKALVNSRAVLGVIPMGSGNGLARHLRIPLNPKQAVSVLNTGKVVQIDTARLNGKFFLSIAGTGFDADVAEKFSKEKRRGFFTYLKVALRDYLKYLPQPYKIILDGREVERKALFISFANSSQFGYNTAIAPQARLDDGLIDVCVVDKPSLFYLPVIAHFLFTSRINKLKTVESFKAKEIRVFRQNNNAVNIDGEPVQVEKDLHILVNPNSLKIIIPS